MKEYLKKLFPYRILFPVLVITIIVDFIVAFISQINIIDSVQKSIQDFDFTDVIYHKISLREDIVDTTIVLVNLGNVKRDSIARIINNVSRYDPAVIGVDAYFFDEKTAKEDSILISSFKNAKNIILPARQYSRQNQKIDSLRFSAEIFSPYVKYSYSELLYEKTGFTDPWTIRHYSPRGSYKDTSINHFCIELIRDYDSDIYSRYIRNLPGKELINYSGNLQNFITIDVKDALNHTLDLSFLENKIIIIGYLGENLHTLDYEYLFYTPLFLKESEKQLPDMYSTVIHANIISMILKNNIKRQVPYWLQIFINAFTVYFFVYFCSFLFNRNETNYPLYSILSLFILLNVIIIGTILVYKYVDIKFNFSIAIVYLIFIPDGFEIYKKNIESRISGISATNWIKLIILLIISFLLDMLVFQLHKLELDIFKWF